MCCVATKNKEVYNMRMQWQCATKVFKDQWLKNLVSTCNMQISDSTIPGLYLRYYARSNQISFYLGYRHLITKKTKNILIGRYCDFKLPEIKEKAIILRQMLAKGWACDLGNFISWLKKEENSIMINLSKGVKCPK